MTTARFVTSMTRTGSPLLRNLGKLGLGMAVTLFFSGTAFAQYGGGTMGGTGMGSGSPTSNYNYGNGKAIGIGIGAAVAGAAALYVAMHHRGSVNGCVSRANNDRLTLLDSKTGENYSLVLSSVDVKPGEQVKLSGKRTKDAEGNNTFEVRKVEKDLGACQ
jgi:hypothetical protein